MNGGFDSPWLASYEPVENADVRLLCFPHAGSSAAAYGRWHAKLPATIEVCPIEYPGRGSRRAEPPFVRVHALVASALAALSPFLTRPFGVFGHCMGGLIAFEFVRQLARLGLPTPIGVFVAGCRAPRLPPVKPPVYALPDQELLRELRSLNGTADEILMNPDFVRLFLPALRADFELADTYAYRPGAALASRILVYAGTDDDDAPPGALDGWSLETSDAFALRLYPGDHFFLQRQESSVLRDLGADLLDAASARRSRE
jgi:medium-chain acyl-[acyl-carrier-protein] hydrolase